MALLEWNQKYSMEIGEIDTQHKQLFSIINRLSARRKLNPDLQDVVHVLEELSDYAKEHFKMEECLMQKTGYTAYVSHNLDHRRFIERIKEFKKMLNGGNIVILTSKLAEFLKNWILDHLILTDHEFYAYIKEKKIKIAKAELILCSH
jgi:hemerythrin